VKSRAAREAPKTLARLGKAHPDAHCELVHKSAFELIIATVLSAQSTDVAVNRLTPEFFARWPDPKKLSAADPAQVEKLLSRIGMFRQKTRNVLGLAKLLIAEHGGEVPRRMAELVRLPGVGRKTANVVLNTAFGQPTMAVDTHIFRIGNRIGLAPGKTPEEVEQGLIHVIPPEYMRHAHHWLILHGRYVCKARRPECERCVIADICKAAVKTNSIPAPLVELKPDALPVPV
jgi:endonuclease III